jgi:hypothetical protein
MQADRRSAPVSPESIETPPHNITPVGEHGSSKIRAFWGIGAVSTGWVCGAKHATGNNATKKASFF